MKLNLRKNRRTENARIIQFVRFRGFARLRAVPVAGKTCPRHVFLHRSPRIPFRFFQTKAAACSGCFRLAPTRGFEPPTYRLGEKESLKNVERTGVFRPPFLLSLNLSLKLTNEALKYPKNPRSLMRLFSMATGMRAGELSALLWEDVPDDFIHVHPSTDS